MRKIVLAISAITALIFVSSFGAAFVGVYIAIWGDNALGGRIIATALTTACLMACVGYPSHLWLESQTPQESASE
jgi:hypothetical protein